MKVKIAQQSEAIGLPIYFAVLIRKSVDGMDFYDVKTNHRNCYKFLLRSAMLEKKSTEIIKEL